MQSFQRVIPDVEGGSAMGERPADRGGSEDLATLEELNRGYVRSAAGPT
jgi:hypothetical protein